MLRASLPQKGVYGILGTPSFPVLSSWIQTEHLKQPWSNPKLPGTALSFCFLINKAFSHSWSVKRQEQQRSEGPWHRCISGGLMTDRSLFVLFCCVPEALPFPTKKLSLIHIKCCWAICPKPGAQQVVTQMGHSWQNATLKKLRSHEM